jgi:hypothetical protein
VTTHKNNENLSAAASRFCKQLNKRCLTFLATDSMSEGHWDGMKLRGLTTIVGIAAGFSFLTQGVCIIVGGGFAQGFARGIKGGMMAVGNGCFCSKRGMKGGMFV